MLSALTHGAVAIVLGALALEVIYDLVAWIYTGIALGFERAFLPWYAASFLHILRVR